MIQKEARKLLKENKVIKIREGMYEVGDKIVTIESFRGRTEVSCKECFPGETTKEKVNINCSCKNHSRYVRRPAICKHKLAVLARWLLE